METTLQRDVKAVVQHLESFDHELTYDELVAEITASAPSGNDIHWMADNQLVNIFFSPSTLGCCARLHEGTKATPGSSMTV
ncbi:hypothetical protein HII28_09555 [Planctomonas sp. JC2975]|uniref:hypothetical protein n=1 Tax=Planctomonas sp. JC2975 TaxID=2729626 RepID=UPI00147385B7|nr:hypothetical protein [Planctomonas sp. JC2975]NNC12121.1 hypothetical protein [Planctomonas sp. JC2975]